MLCARPQSSSRFVTRIEEAARAYEDVTFRNDPLRYLQDAHVRGYAQLQEVAVAATAISLLRHVWTRALRHASSGIALVPLISSRQTIDCTWLAPGIRQCLSAYALPPARQKLGPNTTDASELHRSRIFPRSEHRPDTIKISSIARPLGIVSTQHFLPHTAAKPIEKFLIATEPHINIEKLIPCSGRSLSRCTRPRRQL